MVIPSLQLLMWPPLICPATGWWKHPKGCVSLICKTVISTVFLSPLWFCLHLLKLSHIMHDLAFSTAQALGQSWGTQGIPPDKYYLPGMPGTALRLHLLMLWHKKKRFYYRLFQDILPFVSSVSPDSNSASLFSSLAFLDLYNTVHSPFPVHSTPGIPTTAWGRNENNFLFKM